MSQIRPTSYYYKVSYLSPICNAWINCAPIFHTRQEARNYAAKVSREKGKGTRRRFAPVQVEKDTAGMYSQYC
jgi:hypothetical protein